MPSKISLPKLSKMKYNFAPLLQNKVVLYTFLAMTIVQVAFFANNRDMAALITLGLVGFITSFFSKNMIVILCVALTTTSILTYGIKKNTHEGLENQEDTAEDADGEGDNVNDDEGEGAGAGAVDEKSEDNKKKKKMDDKKKSEDAKPKTDDTEGEKNSAETSDKTKDEKKQEYDNLKQEYPEYKEIQNEIMKGIEKMDPLLQKAEAFINKYSEYKSN